MEMKLCSESKNSARVITVFTKAKRQAVLQEYANEKI